MASVQDAGERQTTVLANVASHVGLIGLDFCITGFEEVVGELGLDSQTDLLAAVPYKDRLLAANQQFSCSHYTEVVAYSCTGSRDLRT